MKILSFLKGALPAVIVYAWNATPIMQRWYEVYPFVDIPMHMLGGAAIAFLVYSLWKDMPEWRALSPLTRIVLLVGGAACVGIAWEWYEFFHDVYFGTHMQLSQADTMKDLFDDLFGAFLTSCFVWYDKK